MNFSADTARTFLVAYLDEVNRLARKPKWYNAFVHNCTTSIRLHVQEIGIARAWNWRVLVNGKGPELLYDRGLPNTRPIEVSPSPFRHRSQSSALCAAVNPKR